MTSLLCGSRVRYQWLMPVLILVLYCSEPYHSWGWIVQRASPTTWVVQPLYNELHAFCPFVLLSFGLSDCYIAFLRYPPLNRSSSYSRRRKLSCKYHHRHHCAPSLPTYLTWLLESSSSRQTIHPRWTRVGPRPGQHCVSIYPYLTCLSSSSRVDWGSKAFCFFASSFLRSFFHPSLSPLLLQLLLPPLSHSSSASSPRHLSRRSL